MCGVLTLFLVNVFVFVVHQKDLRAPPSASPSAPLAGQEVEGELAMMSTVLDTLQQLGISVDDAEVCLSKREFSRSSASSLEAYIFPQSCHLRTSYA